MKIDRRRQIRIETSYEELTIRLSAWANEFGFTLETIADDQMVYARGGGWRAMYTFDITKLPAKVSVKLSGEAPIAVDCTFSVGSRVSTATADDAEKVDEQLDVLVAYLTGASH